MDQELHALMLGAGAKYQPTQVDGKTVHVYDIVVVTSSVREAIWSGHLSLERAVKKFAGGRERPGAHVWPSEAHIAHIGRKFYLLYY